MNKNITVRGPSDLSLQAGLDMTERGGRLDEVMMIVGGGCSEAKAPEPANVGE